MIIWHISDTHQYHELLKIPNNIDIVIHSGDASNVKNPHLNYVEFINFLEWYSKLPIKYKIYVAGNHDTSIEKNLITKRDFDKYGIIYLENDFITIKLDKEIKIWGSPHTPTHGNWAFMKARHKLDRVWNEIPEDVDIIITHGPPKGIMDLTRDYDHKLIQCGCNALRKRVLHIEPSLFLSGHIHNVQDIINAGTLKLSAYKTIFSNGSVVTDNKFGKLSSNGNILDL